MIEDISDFMWNDGKPKDKLRGRLPLSRARLVDYQVYNQIDLGTKTKGRNARENRKSNWSNIHLSIGLWKENLSSTAFATLAKF